MTRRIIFCSQSCMCIRTKDLFYHFNYGLSRCYEKIIFSCFGHIILRRWKMDEAFILVVSYIAIAVYICTVFGNILVIVVIQKDKKLRNSPNTFFLLSLACSDFFFAIFIFLDIIILSNEVTISYFEFFFNALASIYILVALAVERYFAILNPSCTWQEQENVYLLKFCLRYMPSLSS